MDSDEAKLCEENKVDKKKKLDHKDLRAILRILRNVKNRAIDIGEELRVHSRMLKDIKMKYKSNRDLWYIAVAVTWLDGNYDKSGPPYTLHDEEHRHASWWNLLYAVARPIGGNDYALAEITAENKDYEKPPESKQIFSIGDLSIPFTRLRDEQPKSAHDIMGKTKNVWHLWYQIGVVLGVSISELEGILQKNGGNEDNFRDMIDIWMSMGVKKPCWQQLLAAIDAKEGGANPDLADTLAKTIFPMQVAAMSEPREKCQAENNLRPIQAKVQVQESVSSGGLLCRQLGDNDLAEIARTLEVLTKKEIYDVGLALGIKHNRLMRSKDSDFFLTEMINFWLTQVDNVATKGIPSWKVLAEVLENPHIGQRGLAKTIREKYYVS